MNYDASKVHLLDFEILVQPITSTRKGNGKDGIISTANMVVLQLKKFVPYYCGLTSNPACGITYPSLIRFVVP
jgi:hypothetical protein